jgi:hypothetical protein
MWLKQNTGVTLAMGPFVDTSGSQKTALTIAPADVLLSKNGAALAAKSDAATASHSSKAMYLVDLTASDVNTLGRLKVYVSTTGALEVWEDFMVVPSGVYDALISGSDRLDVDSVSLLSSTALSDISGVMTSAISTGTIGSLGTQAKADVNAEVVDALATDQYAEPGQATPSANASITTKISFLHKLARNKIVTSSSEIQIYNDAGDTVDQKATISDDGTSFTREEFQSGP